MLQGPSPGGYDGDEAHGDCRRCVQGLPCHGFCNPEEEDEGTKAAYAAAVDAASKGDARTLLDLEAAAGDYVIYNRDRGAVQLYACDGRTVIASLPLGSAGNFTDSALPGAL